MSYFNYFPEIFYNYEINGRLTLITVKDIALNVRVRKEILQNITLYDEYDIEDGETPESISEKLYGKPYYHWTIMLLNLKFDYITDFPMRESDLELYVTQKYGAGHEYDQHLINGVLHFEDRNGNIVSKFTEEQFNLFKPGMAGQTYQMYSEGFDTISNFEYEQRLNEAKRRIKVLNQTSLERVLKDIQTMMKAA